MQYDHDQMKDTQPGQYTNDGRAARDVTKEPIRAVLRAASNSSQNSSLSPVLHVDTSDSASQHPYLPNRASHPDAQPSPNASRLSNIPGEVYCIDIPSPLANVNTTTGDYSQGLATAYQMQYLQQFSQLRVTTPGVPKPHNVTQESRHKPLLNYHHQQQSFQHQQEYVQVQGQAKRSDSQYPSHVPNLQEQLLQQMQSQQHQQHYLLQPRPQQVQERRQVQDSQQQTHVQEYVHQNLHVMRVQEQHPQQMLIQVEEHHQLMQLETLKKENQDLKEELQQSQQENDIQIQQLQHLQEQHSAVQQEKDIQIQQLQEQHSAVQQIQIEKLQQQLQELEKQLKQQQEDEKESSTLTLTLPGAQLISMGKLTIERSDELQTLEWKNHGLKVHVPPGTLPDSEDTCDIDVATSFSGSFILPKDHSSVSAIYYIQPSMKLTKPVTLEIEHCCSIETENDTKSIVPIYAQSSIRNPPYIFKPLDSGTIAVTRGSSWVSFEVSTFSWFTLSWFKYCFGQNEQQEDTEEESDSNLPAVYSGQVYCCSEDRDRGFTLKLIVFPHLTECFEVCAIIMLCYMF